MSRAALILFLLASCLGVTARGEPSVAVIADAAWSPGDAPRDGAAELEVLLHLARLQQAHESVGLVGIGDRHGFFQEGTQRALEFAVQQGVPVVRLARGSAATAPADGDLFINGGNLSPETASSILATCLIRYGPLPKIRIARQPTADELRSYRRKLQLYQNQFVPNQLFAVAAR